MCIYEYMQQQLWKRWLLVRKREMRVYGNVWRKEAEGEWYNYITISRNKRNIKEKIMNETLESGKISNVHGPGNLILQNTYLTRNDMHINENPLKNIFLFFKVMVFKSQDL